MPHYTKDLNKVIAGLKKASKLHAGQAKVLEKIKKDQAKRYETKPKKTVVANTKAAKVKNMKEGGLVARGCGAIMSNRRKRTKGSVSKV